MWRRVAAAGPVEAPGQGFHEVSNTCVMALFVPAPDAPLALFAPAFGTAQIRLVCHARVEAKPLRVDPLRSASRSLP